MCQPAWSITRRQRRLPNTPLRWSRNRLIMIVLTHGRNRLTPSPLSDLSRCKHRKFDNQAVQQSPGARPCEPNVVQPPVGIQSALHQRRRCGRQGVHIAVVGVFLKASCACSSPFAWRGLGTFSFRFSLRSQTQIVLTPRTIPKWSMMACRSRSRVQ